MDDQQLVTEDVDRVHRLQDLRLEGILDPSDAAFVDQLEQSHVGTAIESEVTVGAAIAPNSHRRITLNEGQRQRADAILAAHGK
jgi:hypothetical protein